MAQRNSWLDIDFTQAVMAATECHMFHEALLFLEIHHSQARLQGGRSSRKSFASLASVSHAIETSIYENVDDPDFFYGKHEDSDLHSVLAKLAHEGASQKALSFQSAFLDSHLSIEGADGLSETVRVTSTALRSANMHGIAEAVKQYYDNPDQRFHVAEASSPFSSLTQWDVVSSNELPGRSSNIGALFRSMHQASSKIGLESALDQSLLDMITQLTSVTAGGAQTNTLLSQLAVLAEARQVLTAGTQQEVDSIWKCIISRDKQIQRAE
jgi:ataxia telangiectasia mutated family protein